MKTRRLRKQIMTRRDFLARSTTFMAMAGIPLAIRPFMRDFFIQNAYAEEGQVASHVLWSTEAGGLPNCTHVFPSSKLPGAGPTHPQLAYYSLNGADPFVTVQGGRQLILPPPFSVLPAGFLQNISTHNGYGGGISGHDVPSKASLATLHGAQDSPEILAAQVHQNTLSTPFPSIEFRANNMASSNLVNSSAIFSPLTVPMPNADEAVSNLQAALTPVSSSLVQMEPDEVDLVKAALYWISELFGAKLVHTANVSKSVAAIQKSTQDLFNVNIPVNLTPEIKSAYGLDLAGEGSVNPLLINDIPAGFDLINFRLFFALAEVCISNNIAPNCSYGYTSQDFHRAIDQGNANEPIFKIQAHCAEALRIFLNRTRNIIDPLSPDGSWSLADNMTIMNTTIQGRAILNDNSWADIGNLWAFVYNKRPLGLPEIRPGSYGDITSNGLPRGTAPDGSLLPAGIAGNPKDFVTTLWDAIGVEGPEVEGAQKLTGILG